MQVTEIHFQGLFSETGLKENDLNSEVLFNIPSLVTNETNWELMDPFTEEEIIDVIWSMDPDKAPVPDGFSFKFYRVCWTVIKKDLPRMIKAFQLKAQIGGCNNSTFLALIPKEVNPTTFERFRSISLYNASYKILSKLLDNWIKPLLRKLISPLQGGFIEGRYTLDNVIHVQEAMQSSFQRQEKGMLIKIDVANSLDKVRLSFLYKVLLSFGFSSAFVNLIKSWTDKPWAAPLINGRPTNFFQATRGLRQGCPLLSFLYILMVESLSRKLSIEKEAEIIPGIKSAIGVDSINHALYAKDSLLLRGASLRMARAFKEILQNFCLITGALINNRKRISLNNLEYIKHIRIFWIWHLG